MAVVLKTTEPGTVPGVRIPLSPPQLARSFCRSEPASVTPLPAERGTRAWANPESSPRQLARLVLPERAGSVTPLPAERGTRAWANPESSPHNSRGSFAGASSSVTPPPWAPPSRFHAPETLHLKRRARSDRSRDESVIGRRPFAPATRTVHHGNRHNQERFSFSPAIADGGIPVAPYWCSQQPETAGRKTMNLNLDAIMTELDGWFSILTIFWGT